MTVTTPNQVEQETTTEASVAAEGITRAPVDWATIPRVDLLPPEIIEKRQLVRTQRNMGAVVLLVVLIVAGLYALSQMQANKAQENLDAATAKQNGLQQEANSYSEVPKIKEQIDSAKTARAQAMSNDVLWYRFLDDLAVATPPNVWLDKVAVTLGDGTNASGGTGATGAAASGAATGNSSKIGQVTFSGSASQFPDVAQWLTQAGAVNGMDIASLQSATKGTSTSGGSTSGAAASQNANTLTFSSQVDVVSAALSHRYDGKDTGNAQK